MSQYSDLQLDALGELANIGSGTAGTALSQLVGCSVDLSVPSAQVLGMADAVDAIGDPETEATAVLLGVSGDLAGSVLLLFTPADAARLCTLLGVEPDSELAGSALLEVGNIVGSSYLGALAAMTSMAFEPTPPAATTDMLGAILESVLAERAGAADVALLLETDLAVEGTDASVSFLLIPEAGGVERLLARLGL